MVIKMSDEQFEQFITCIWSIQFWLIVLVLIQIGSSIFKTLI